MKTFNLNIPISKVDEEKRIVYGVATKEELDHQGDIVDYEASKKAFSAWAGNIREQHDSKRVIGKKVSMDFDDDNEQVLVGAYISKSPDGENAWTKVKEGLFTGFSIGGKVKQIVKEKLNKDGSEVSANRIMDYDLAELSLVDVPACPSAQLIMVKSVNGKAQEVEEFHGQELPWFMKTYAYSEAQVNYFNKISENKSMEKKKYTDEQRKEMASKGQALPDGSFPIADVEDLKNAIHAYGRAKDKAAAKTFIIKRAKALGATDLLPEDWDTKGVKAEMEKNVVGGEERDADAKVTQPEAAPEAAPEVTEPEVTEKPTEEVAEPDKVEVKVEAKTDKKTKAEEAEVKKGLWTVADLANCIEQLTQIVQSAEFEAEYEQDNSPVPAQLKAAVAQVGEAFVAMAQEETAEAAAGKDVEATALPVAPVELSTDATDLKKMVDEKLGTTKDDLLKSLTEAVSGKVAEMLTPLEDRLKAIESQPVGQAPKRQYVEVAKGEEPAEDALMLKAKDMEENPNKYSPLERADLAAELFKRSSYSRPISVK